MHKCLVAICMLAWFHHYLKVPTQYGVPCEDGLPHRAALGADYTTLRNGTYVSDIIHRAHVPTLQQLPPHSLGKPEVAWYQ